MTKDVINKSAKYNLLLFFICFSFGAVSQYPNKDIDKLYEKYGKAAIVLQKAEHLTIENNGNSLQISSDHHVEKLFLSGKHHMFGDEVIYYNSFILVEDIDAWLKTASGKKRKIKDIRTKDEFGGSNFFDDGKVKHIIFPKINKGDRTILEHTEKLSDPHFLSAFYFSSYLPVIRSEFSITFPKSVDIGYIIMNDNANKIKKSVVKKRKETTITFTTEKLPGPDFTHQSVPAGYTNLHIIPYIKKFRTKNGEKNILTGVHDLYAWYRSFIDNHPPTPPAPIQLLVDSLITGATNNEDKARRIFYWVQENINYLAFEDGYSGFIPDSPGNVLHKKYGDCKGMSSLLVSMLHAAGLPGYFTWIGTRDLPYSYSDVHSPIVDNHMIATTMIEDSIIFLDATDSYSSLYLPPDHIQGKEALIGISDSEYLIRKVPVIEKEKNFFMDSVTLRIDGTTLKGRGVAGFGGYRKSSVARRIDRSKESEIKEYLSALLQKGNNKFTLTDYNILNQYQKDEELKIRYNFMIPDYALNLDGKIYINMNLGGMKAQTVSKDLEKDTMMSISHKSVTSFHYVLKVPEKYIPVSIPGNDSFEGSVAGYELTYKKKDSSIVHAGKFFVDGILLYQKQIKEMKEVIENLQTATLKTVELKKQ